MLKTPVLPSIFEYKNEMYLKLYIYIYILFIFNLFAVEKTLGSTALSAETILHPIEDSERGSHTTPDHP